MACQATLQSSRLYFKFFARSFCQSAPLEALTLSKRKLQYYSLSGTGEKTIVLLHGSPGSHKDFKYLVPYFEGKARLLEFDLPGYGLTPAESTMGPKNPAIADTIVEAMNQLQVNENLILLGHSIGGHLALEIASRNPRAVQGLALLCSVGLRPHRAARPYHLVRMATNAMNNPVLFPLLAPISEWFFKNILRFPASTPREAILNAQQRIVGADYDHVLSTVIPAVKDIPILISWADDDLLIEPAIPLEMSEAFTHSTKLHFTEGGHNIQKTKAQTIATTIIELFLDPKMAKE